VADFEAFEDALVEGEKRIMKDFTIKTAWALGEAMARFVRDSEAGLKRWTARLQSRKITRAEFECLVHGQEHLFQIHLLTETGIFRAEAKALKEAQLRFIVNTAVEVFL
jgi:hypothetical protein